MIQPILVLSALLFEIKTREKEKNNKISCGTWYKSKLQYH